MQSDQPNTRYHRISPGALWDAIIHQTRLAIQAGALQGIATEQVRIRDGGVPFLVRAVSSLRHKPRNTTTVAKAQQIDTEFDPFLPPEPPLTLGEISPSHLAVLNKFNVLDHHLLLVTRDFEDQESWLTLADMAALRFALSAGDGLAFYNGGQAAGASQRHKHLQWIPLPLIEGEPLPIEKILHQGLPFSHALVSLEGLEWRDETHAPEQLLSHYAALLGEIGIGAENRGGRLVQSAPYNLLITRRWMLAVPRVRECLDSISLNSLGFAGSLFVRDEREMGILQEIGPMRLLQTLVDG
jgi:ATP adenylyltransferase